ncbi:hypothetical protein E2C01_004273 [Portunus trituberculatus]|uniref:Uncharacterized protein n=1 Tax=Portunus trituberculatus TaxID=210409 RepID=A0A5B7CVY4_PORTR|nr:hypothetical protein [Portunus trituberculatus]
MSTLLDSRRVTLIVYVHEFRQAAREGRWWVRRGGDMDGQREVRLPCGHQYMAEGLGVAVLTCPDCNVNHTVDLRNAHDLPPDLDLLKVRMLSGVRGVTDDNECVDDG